MSKAEGGRPNAEFGMANLESAAAESGRGGGFFFGEDAAAAVGADAEGGFDAELFCQVIFERDPIALALEFSAPATHLELVLEIIKAFQDPPGGDEDANPDGDNGERFERALVPVRHRHAAEDQLRQTN